MLSITAADCRENFELLMDDSSFREELPNFRLVHCGNRHICLYFVHPAWTVNAQWFQQTTERNCYQSWLGEWKHEDLWHPYDVTIALGYCMGVCRSRGVLVGQNLEETPGGGWCWDFLVAARAVRWPSSSVFSFCHSRTFFYQVHVDEMHILDHRSACTCMFKILKGGEGLKFLLSLL